MDPILIYYVLLPLWVAFYYDIVLEKLCRAHNGETWTSFVTTISFFIYEGYLENNLFRNNLMKREGSIIMFAAAHTSA